MGNGAMCVGGWKGTAAGGWPWQACAWVQHGQQASEWAEGGRGSSQTSGLSLYDPMAVPPAGHSGSHDSSADKPTRGSWTHHTLQCVVGCFRTKHFARHCNLTMWLCMQEEGTIA